MDTGCGRNAATPIPFHFTREPMPSIDPEWENPKGVLMSALSSGVVATVFIPLVYQSFNWSFGVYLAATMGSETTLPQQVLWHVRRDHLPCFPSAAIMWLIISPTGCRSAGPPRSQRASSASHWFRKDANGKFLWPATAKTCASSNGSWIASMVTQPPLKARWAGCRVLKTWTGRTWNSVSVNSSMI